MLSTFVSPDAWKRSSGGGNNAIKASFRHMQRNGGADYCRRNWATDSLAAGSQVSGSQLGCPVQVSPGQRDCARINRVGFGVSWQAEKDALGNWRNTSSIRPADVTLFGFKSCGDFNDDSRHAMCVCEDKMYIGYKADSHVGHSAFGKIA